MCMEAAMCDTQDIIYGCRRWASWMCMEAAMCDTQEHISSSVDNKKRILLGVFQEILLFAFEDALAAEVPLPLLLPRLLNITQSAGYP